ncbi:hypothetical protein EDB86DRAFT_1458887 [Lactarius hatsudake]|nr:hypothetical protein EDB86DRAFT_1458887 [Lactarius hatsudake]
MESFSWSDSLRALAAPCLSCLRASKTERNDLEDLLVDSASGTTTDRDAETLSLHSNPGAPRRKRTRFTKSIRLFGWNLFGRPPIRLPDDDEEEEEEGREQGQGSGSRRRSRRAPPPALSSSTLDSDAAPLDSAAIESHATKRAEEEAARAERRARRRERKERKSAALALALEHGSVLDGNAEFEGFPGSGGRRPPLPASPFARSSEGDSRDDDEDDDEGDFGAGAYARRTRGGSDSGRGSDSRSRTSTSLSSGPQLHGQPYNHHYISQQPSAHPAVPPPAVTHRSKKGKSSRSSASKTSSSSRRSRSSPSASQSPSLASPVATQFLDAAAPAPRTAQEFEGFPSDLGLHTAGIERLSSGFPSPGIGGRRNGKRDMGAFLANRGDA